MRVLTLSRYLNIVFGGGMPLVIGGFGASTAMKLEKMKWISGVTINTYI